MLTFVIVALKAQKRIAQGAAALYPGLCSSALTARAAQYILCEKVVRVNQEQFHFGYIKMYTLYNKFNAYVVT